MDEIETLSEQRCFGGVQGYYRHRSASVGLPMRFGVYRPPQAETGRVPVLFYLAGLTCNEETFATKAGAQQHAARFGLMLVTPDTSPRDTGIASADDDWDFGHGAGFYLDAVAPPWNRHFRMASYVADELPELIRAHFPALAARQGIFGHSMGGHGALTLALKRPGRYHSVSALAPISAPTQCPWGRKAFAGYLGADEALWREHDASALIRAGARTPPLLVDQGLADKFRLEQLGIDALQAACSEAGQPLALRHHPGYDHSYYFIASCVADHIAHHAAALAA